MKKATSFAFYFLYYGAFAAFMPYIVLYYQSLGFNGAQIGLLTSLSPLLALTGAPLLTGLADSARRHRLVMSLAMLVTVTVIALFPLLTTFLPVLAAVFFYALLSSPVISMADSATMTALGQRPELYGRLRLGGTIGWGIASPIIGAFIQDHELRLVFYIAAAGMFLALLVSQNFSYRQSSTVHSPLSGARLLLANRRFVLFLLMALASGIGLSTVNNYLFPYMEELHISKSLMGVSMTLSTVSELPVLLFSNRLLKRLKPHGLLVLGMGMTALRLLLFAAASSATEVLVFQLINGLTFGAVWVAGVSYAEQSAPPGLSASAQGLFSAVVFGIGAAIGGFAGSLLLEALGGRLMFLVAGVFVLLSMGVLLLLERRCSSNG